MDELSERISRGSKDGHTRSNSRIGDDTYPKIARHEIEWISKEDSTHEVSTPA